MRKLRILIHDIGIGTPDFDYRQSGAKGLYPLLQELHKMLDFEEIWVYFKGGSEDFNSKTNGYHASSFSDGLDLVDKLKPDLILTRSDYEFLTRSILIAARRKSIPSIALISIRPYIWDKKGPSTLSIARGKISWLSINSKSIVKRYTFLLNTIRRCGLGPIYFLKTIITDFYLTFKTNEPTFRLGLADLYIANNPKWRNHLMRYNVDDKRIVVVGECAMDLTYNKIAGMKKTNHDGIEILFITTALVEHGNWTPNMRDRLVTGVVKAITEYFPRAKLTIKIHPGESLEHYKKITYSINPALDIIEFGDLLSLIYNSDIIIGMGLSTAMFDALLLDKPIFIMNLYDDQKRNFLITNKLATECKSIEALVEGIKEPNLTKPDAASLQTFIEEQIYKFDGNCSKRAAEAILNLISEKISQSSSYGN